MKNKKYKYLGKNTLIFTISSFGTKFLSFFLVPLYTNVLTTKEYGIIDIINTSGILMTYIFTLNISDAVLRFAIEQKNEHEKILKYGIYVLLKGSLLLLVSLCLFKYLNIITWNKTYLFFMFLFYFSTALYQILSNYLRAIDKMTEVAVTGIVTSLVMIVCNIYFLLVVKYGMIGYLLAQIIGPLIASVYILWIIKDSLIETIASKVDHSIKKEMVAYSIPLIFSSISLWINAYLDRYFITLMIGSSENGIYAMAGKIPTILTTCYTVFSLAWNISAIKEFDAKDEDGFISTTYELYNSLLTMVCSGLILINVPLAKILYAGDFFVAWKYSSIMLIYVMFNALTAFFGSLFSAMKKTKVIAMTTIISAVVNIVLNLVLIPKYGILGAAIATVACYVVMWSVRYLILRDMMTFDIPIKKHLVIYTLLILQVVFEHFDNHLYVGQIAVILLLLYINRDKLMVLKKSLMERR